MILTTVGLGSSIFGMLPFALEYAVYLVDPVSENVVCGLIYFVAMIIAAGGNQILSYISPFACVLWLCIFCAVEFYLFRIYSLPKCKAIKEGQVPDDAKEGTDKAAEPSSPVGSAEEANSHGGRVVGGVAISI